MAVSLESRCRRLLHDLGLAEANDPLEVAPLAGGVASDIARVTVGEHAYCVKFALERLKVEEDWRVPVHRNRAEYAWLQFAATIVPSSVPRLYGQSDLGFAMEYLAPGEVRLWKDALLHEAPDIQHAKSVAAAIAKIHSASTRSEFRQRAFMNHDDFRAIRIEPYLTFTASRHASLARHLERLGDRLYYSRTALVHGDVSPKNILFRGDSPVLLDAECATMGDPAFDVAFCLNHLVLKSMHRPEHCNDLHLAALEFWASYAEHVDWEPRRDLEARAAELIPALMLARVDGKSPVEYLSGANQDRVRGLAISLIPNPLPTLSDLFRTLQER